VYDPQNGDDTRVGHSYNAGKYLSCIPTIQAQTLRNCT